MWHLSTLVTLAIGTLASAKPLVVDLETNWLQSPYKAQVLETIGNYNSSAYFPLLSLILSHEEQHGELTDELLHSFTLEKVRKTGFITETQINLLEADIALGTYTAAIEAKYQTFREEFPDLIDCENVLYYNGKPTCDSGAVFALETNAVSDATIFEYDRIIGGNTDAPWAILYADLTTKTFPVFHAHLLASALEGKINYVLRYKPSTNVPLQKLGGWGATAQVKRTDYLVVDDRELKEELKLNMEAPNKISKKELPKLSFKLATQILKSKDRFGALTDFVLNLPSHLATLQTTKVSAKVMEDSEQNGESFFSPGTNTLLVNGASVSPNNDFNIYQLMDTLGEELKLVEQLEKLGLSTADARDLITSGIVEEDPDHVIENAATKRYDYRSDAVIWINDLEKSKMYATLPAHLEPLKDPEARLIAVKRNIHNLVIAADLEQLTHLQLVAQVFQMISRRAPIRVGIVPIGNGERAQKFLEAAESGSFFVRQKYLVQLMEGVSPTAALEEARKFSQDGALDPRTGDIKKEITKWTETFGTDGGMIMANGFIIPATQEWVYEAMTTLVTDEMRLRELVNEGKLALDDTTTDLEKLLLSDSHSSRDDLIDPADPASVKYISTGPLFTDSYGYYGEWNARAPTERSVWIVGDLNSERGVEQLIEGLKLAEKNFTLRALPIIKGERVSDPLYRNFVNSIVEQAQRPGAIAKLALESYKEHIFHHGPRPKFLNNVTEVVNEAQMEHLYRTFISSELSKHFSADTVSLVVDGRLVQTDKVIDSDSIIALLDRETPRVERLSKKIPDATALVKEQAGSLATHSWYKAATSRVVSRPWFGQQRTIAHEKPDAKLEVTAVIDPVTEDAQMIVSLLEFVKNLDIASIKVFLSPKTISTKGDAKIPNRYYKGVYPHKPEFASSNVKVPMANFDNLDEDTLYVIGIQEPAPWVVMTRACDYDLDNVVLNTVKDDTLFATYELRSLLIEGSAIDSVTRQPPRGTQITLGSSQNPGLTDTMVMANLGYYQLQAQPGTWQLSLKDGPSKETYDFVYQGKSVDAIPIHLKSLQGVATSFFVNKKPGKENVDVAAGLTHQKSSGGFFGRVGSLLSKQKEGADVNIFTVASGHLYERFLSIMTLSVMRHTKHTVKFWLIENFLSPSFKEFLPELARKYNFDFEFITYKWPHWLRHQSEKQREIWGYKILFLDVLFPQNLEKVMFIDSDQIVRTDLNELNEVDLKGAPYGFTPMGEDREETEGFRFWKQGYWLEFLKGKPYHISALYVVDLNRFRELGAGDILRQHYQQLSADPASLANLDQDLPNNLQAVVPIHSLDQDWLWCETWCADEGLKTAKTIDLCNNPLTKEPKLDRARRQIPEWNDYDNTVAELRSDFFANKKKDVETSVGEEPEEEEEEHYDL